MSSLIDPPSRGRSCEIPPRGNQYVFDVLSILFLIAIVSLMSLVFLPRVFTAMTYPKERPIDYVIRVEEEGEFIPEPANDPGPVIGPHNDGRERKPLPIPDQPVERTTESALPIIPPRRRLPHPEESDEDDLPLLYRGLNPSRPHKLRVSYRLAQWILPIHYDVRLNVSVRGHNGAEESSVEGKATIEFKVRGDASNLLEIHGEFFKSFNFISLTYGAKVEINTIRLFYNEEKRTYVFLLNQPLKDGEKYVLNVDWIGSIGHGTMGLYETWYFDGRENRYSLSSQGEPMSTRKWMPCFDEPSMKAILNLTVIHPSSLTARSNGRIDSALPVEGTNITRTHFAPTPSISPYLYALSVTDYLELKDTVEGIPISVVVPPTHKSHLESSLLLAKQSVNSYLSILNATRIFDKMDFVFVPDHGSAMENVGHITFGIKLIDDYPTYAHEMMHNYFGNLITLAWWDEVWINEGLTTVYEIDAVHGKDTEGLTENYRKIRRDIMREFDSFRKTIPLKYEATTEVEAHENFVKPYSKGAVVLFMIRNVIGEERWKTGIENFLRKFEFKAVNGIDFLETMTKVENGRSEYGEEGEMAMRMGRSFLENRGFPLVRMVREARTIEFTQERFHRGFINGKKENKEKWTIPLHLVRLDGTPYKTFFLTDQRLSIEVDIDDVLVLDPSKVVFYRVVYDKATYRAIVSSSLSNSTKDEMVDDLLHSAYSGYIPASLAYSIFSLRKSPHLSNTVWHLHSRVTLLHPHRLSSMAQIFKGINQTEFDDWERTRFTTKKSELCDGIHTERDLVLKYSTNRTIEYFFCPQILDSWSTEQFKKIIKEGLDLNHTQTIHPTDFKGFLHRYNDLKPGVVADVALEMASTIDYEFVLAQLIARARFGMDVRSADQLRKIVEMAPGAARQNGAFITKIFNERHSIETEDRQLGSELDVAFRETFKKTRKLKKTRTSKDRIPFEIPEESFKGHKFY